MRFLKSAGIGLLLTIALGVLSFTVTFLRAFDAFVFPARLLFLVLDRFKLDSLLNWLALGEGPPAGVALIMLSSFVSWSLIFSTAHFLWSKARLQQNGKA